MNEDRVTVDPEMIARRQEARKAGRILADLVAEVLTDAGDTGADCREIVRRMVLDAIGSGNRPEGATAIEMPILCGAETVRKIRAGLETAE